MSNPKPNILFVMADQITAFALKAYGNSVCKTPHLDNLIKEAAVFENAYCNYPLCAPSRFSMLTGRMPSSIEAYDNGAEMSASVPTLAHYLRAEGYYTSLSGKMHFIGPDQHHGYEERLTTEIYPSDFSWTPMRSFDEPVEGEQVTLGVSTMDTVLDAGCMARTMQLDYDEDVSHAAVKELYHLARSDSERPFFLTVSFTQPHDPYITTKEWWHLYDDIDIGKPDVDFVPLDERDPHSRSLYYHYSQDKSVLTDDNFQKARQAYYGMISYIDHQLGKLVEVLKETGEIDNTIIVFTSDHGDMIGERGMWFKKTLFEPAVRVPLVIWNPNSIEAKRISTPVSLIDILPSLIELSGSNQNNLLPIDGTSFVPLIQSKTDEHPPVFCEHIDGGTLAPRIMIRDGRYKLVVSAAYPDILFNLDDDPNESKNLAENSNYAEVLAELKEKLFTNYDLADLKQNVIANQKQRRVIEKAVGQGKIVDYTFQTEDKYNDSYVRRGDDFPEVEQRGYLRYKNKKSTT